MKLKKIAGALIDEMRSAVGAQALNDRKDIGALTLSSESMDESARSAAVAARNTLDEVITNSIQLVLSTENSQMVITDAQRQAASKIAALASDPKVGMQVIAGAQSPAAGSGAINLSAEAMGVIDSVDSAVLSTETFDDQQLNNTMYFSIVYNLFGARQDEFGETFFPTITVDPAQSGVAIATEVTSLYSDFARTTDGAKSRSKFAKVTLAKAIYTNNLLNADRNRAIPVSRAENTALVIPALAYVDNSTGVDITTAPLRTGATIDLLGISQTDAMLAKGSMDAYDTLDRTLNVESLVIKLSAVIATVPTTEYFRIPVGMLEGSNFTYTSQGHEKDLGLDFDTLNVSLFTSTSLQYDGTPSAILASLPIGHRVKLHLKLTGDGNTQYGDVAVYSTVAEIDSIYDAAGNKLLTTDADYITIDGVITPFTVDGYILEAWLTNSNLRTQGQMVTVDRYEQIYAVPVRSGVSVAMPVNSGGNDDSRLVGQIQTTGYRMSLDAVKTLVAFTDNLKALTNNGANTDIGLMGIGRYHVDAYYSESTIDLATVVDSVSSADRSEDIRASLIGTIRDAVYRAYTQSKYQLTHDLLHGKSDKPIGVIIGTSSRVKQYLTVDSDIIALSSEFNAKIVASPSPTIGDSMYITFTDYDDSERNATINPIGLGQCIWAPTITTDVATTLNGAVTRRFQTHPRYIHIVNLPIMIRLNVTNIVAVLGKVARNQHTV